VTLGKKLMRIVLRLFKWSWRAWPALLLIALICIHLLLIYYFRLNASTTNKTISLTSQLVGGLLILYSIDSNIEIIKKKNLRAVFINYLKEFPLIKRFPVVINGLGAAIAVGSEGKFTVGRNPQTIDEKLEYLQEQINEVKQDLEQGLRELNEKIERMSKEMNAQIQETKTKQQNLESKTEEVFIGGIKVQLFGVLLMIYGASSGYLA
jgi:hypothetical protein